MWSKTLSFHRWIVQRFRTHLHQALIFAHKNRIQSDCILKWSLHLVSFLFSLCQYSAFFSVLVGYYYFNAILLALCDIQSTDQVDQILIIVCFVSISCVVFPYFHPVWFQRHSSLAIYSCLLRPLLFRHGYSYFCIWCVAVGLWCICILLKLFLRVLFSKLFCGCEVEQLVISPNLEISRVSKCSSRRYLRRDHRRMEHSILIVALSRISVSHPVIGRGKSWWHEVIGLPQSGPLANVHSSSVVRNAAMNVGLWTWNMLFCGIAGSPFMIKILIWIPECREYFLTTLSLWPPSPEYLPSQLPFLVVALFLRLVDLVLHD